TGQPNQVVPLPVGHLVIDEQAISASATSAAMTVNALHLTAGRQTDIALASSSAGVTRGSRDCGNVPAVTTGGGYSFGTGGVKDTFGFVAGMKGGSPFGHVVFVDHAAALEVPGPILAYTP